METTRNKPKLLLHTCCAVCGAYLTEILKEKFTPVIYFSNPNIHPAEEYENRKNSAQKLAEIYNIEFAKDKYEPENWFQEIKGFEKEPEGGKRCPVCFAMRLKRTAGLAKEKNIEFFTTTLAVSPYKNEKIINELGKKIAKVNSLAFISSSDFNQTKQEIWKKTRSLAREFGFYHQKYCGCEYSIRIKPTKKD